MTYKNISPKEFKELIGQPDYELIDVRTKEEYVEGQIPDHVLLDFKDADFLDHVQDLDKMKNYLVYCRSGNRSGQTCQLMGSMDFKGELYNLDGGIQAWNAEFELD